MYDLSLSIFSPALPELEVDPLERDEEEGSARQALPPLDGEEVGPPLSYEQTGTAIMDDD